MTPFTHPISANQLLTESLLQVTLANQRAVLDLLADSSKLMEPLINGPDGLRGKLEHSVAQVEQFVARAVLEGRGLKGHRRTDRGLSVDTKMPVSKALPAVAEDPADAEFVAKTLFRAFGMTFQQNGQVSWAAPTKENYGRAVKTPLSTEDASKVNAAEMATGIYPVIDGDQLRGFILIVKVSDDLTLTLTSQEPAKLLSYVGIEDEWIPHRQWDYLSCEAFNRELDKITGDTIAEFTFDSKKWAALTKAVPKSAYGELQIEETNGGGARVPVIGGLRMEWRGKDVYLVHLQGDVEGEPARFDPANQYDISYPLLHTALKQLETRLVGLTPVKPSPAKRTRR